MDEWHDLFDPSYRDNVIYDLREQLKAIPLGYTPEIQNPIRRILLPCLDEYLRTHGYPDRRTTDIEAAVEFALCARQLAEGLDEACVDESDASEFEKRWAEFIVECAAPSVYHDLPRRNESLRKISRCSRKRKLPTVEEAAGKIRDLMNGERSLNLNDACSVYRQLLSGKASKTAIYSRIKQAKEKINTT